MKIADKDKDRLFLLRDYYSANRMLPPSFSQIGKVIRIKSKSAVSDFLERLCNQKIIKKMPGGKVAPTLSFFVCKACGLDNAKLPLPDPDMLGDVLNLDEFLIKKPSKTKILQMEGDFLIDSGIKDGDYLIVVREVPNNGDIVFVNVNGDPNAGYYRKEANGIYLDSKAGMNSMQHPNHLNQNDCKILSVTLEGKFEILGIVTGMFRQF